MTSTILPITGECSRTPSFLPQRGDHKFVKSVIEEYGEEPEEVKLR
jgi:hypothetical protein